MKSRWNLNGRRLAAGLCALLFAVSVLPLSAQVAYPAGQAEAPQPVDSGQPAPLLNANQLDDLIAPIALYPDPLISQILVASTYPLEVVEAYQWLQRNPGLSGTALTQAAEGQNWDPSVQALVMFPDVLKHL